MALTKPTPLPESAAAAVKVPVGSFESMDETTTSAPAANDTTASAPAEAPAAATKPAAEPAPANATAVAAAPATAVAVRQEASAFQKEVEAMKGGGDFSYGNYEVFKAINGSIKGTGDNTASLGRWVKVTMIAWDDRVQISPGADSAPKDCVGYSKDGITIDSVIGFEKYGMWVGKKVDDYVQHLKDSDWLKASASRYIDVACVVHEGEKQAAKDLAGEIICISLSKSSIPSFSSYQEKLNMKGKAAARGIPGVVVPADPFTFYFICEAASKDGKDWTKLKVSDKLKIEE